VSSCHLFMLLADLCHQRALRLPFREEEHVLRKTLTARFVLALVLLAALAAALGDSPWGPN
jgi:hypothetical protein